MMVPHVLSCEKKTGRKLEYIGLLQPRLLQIIVRRWDIMEMCFALVIFLKIFCEFDRFCIQNQVYQSGLCCLFETFASMFHNPPSMCHNLLNLTVKASRIPW